MEEIEEKNISENESDSTDENITENLVEPEETAETENSPEASEETPSESIESVEIKTENANTTNCLALTIQEDHKLVALKNVFLRSIRMSWKVAVSTITLALLKLFS